MRLKDHMVIIKHSIMAAIFIVDMPGFDIDHQASEV